MQGIQCGNQSIWTVAECENLDRDTPVETDNVLCGMFLLVGIVVANIGCCFP